MPDSVGFCLVFQDLRGHAAAWQTSPFVQQLSRSPFAVKLRNSDKWKKLAQCESEMKEKLGFDWKRLRDDILGDAVVLAYRPGSPGQPKQEQGVVLLRARNEKVLAELMERVNKVQAEEGELSDLSERRHNGIVYYRRLEYDKRTQRDKPPTYYYIQGPILALSEQEEMLREVISRSRVAASDVPDAAPEAERRLRELDAERALLAVWLNPRVFDAGMDAKIANAPGQRSAAVKQFALYWKALESVVISLSPRERDLQLSLGVRARVAELPTPARRMFHTAATTCDLWRRFPQSALVAVGGRIDTAALLDVLGGFLTPEAQKALHSALNRPFASLLAEEDFAGNLLPALGPDWGLCLSAPSAGAAAPGSSREKQAMPNFLFALRVDAQRTKKSLESTLLTALDFAARFFVFAHNNQDPDAPLALKSIAFHGHEVRYLSGQNGLPAGVQPAYGLLHGYLVLAGSLESVKRFAETMPAAVTNADAPTPLLRISFKDWRRYLAEYREPIAQLFAEHDKLNPEAAARQVDALIATLQFVERAELSQRSTPNQVIFTLVVQTAQALRK